MLITEVVHQAIEFEEYFGMIANRQSKRWRGCLNTGRPSLHCSLEHDCLRPIEQALL
jgi:hypothetical protein